MLVGEGVLLLVGKVVVVDLYQLLDKHYACIGGSVLVVGRVSLWLTDGCSRISATVVL